MERIREIDILRGFAIFVMVIANFSPYFVNSPNEFLRLIYTFAAPLFVSITGYLAYLNHEAKNYNWEYYFKRGSLLIISYSLLEVLLYKSFPLFSFDVLYLIGISTILFPLLVKIWKKLNIWIIFIIFLFTMYLQKWYNPNITEYPIGQKFELVQFFSGLVKHSLIDGWFPIFPWIGIFMLGFAIYEYRELIKKTFLLWPLFFLVLSVILVNTNKVLREGYAELFYPPDIIFILWVISFLSLSFSLVFYNFWSKTIFKSYLEIIGKSSLFFYIFHLIMVEMVFSKIFIAKEDSYIFLFLSWGINLVLMGFIGLIFENIKKKYKIPFIIKFFIGS